MWIRTAAGGGPGQPWPVARSYHSAVSLHHPDGSVSDPALVVWWGDVGHGKAGRDAWVFQVNTLQWREVRVVYYVPCLLEICAISKLCEFPVCVTSSGIVRVTPVMECGFDAVVCDLGPL